MVRLRTAAVARSMKKELFSFPLGRAKNLAASNPALAGDYILRALNVKQDQEALTLGAQLGVALNQPELVDKCMDQLSARGASEVVTSSLLENAEEVKSERYVVAETAALGTPGSTLEAYVTQLTKGKVEVKELPSSIMGRGLFAREKLLKGTTVAVESATATIPLNESSCSHCLCSLPLSPVTCDGCGEKYCSEGCKLAALEGYHAPICQNQEYRHWEAGVTDMFRNPGVDTSDSKTALEMLLMGRMCAAATMEQTHPRVRSPINELRGEISYHPQTAFSSLGAITVGLGAALRQEHFYLEDTVSLLAIIKANEHQIPSGLLLFRGFSLLNHSCVPNCAVVGDSSAGGAGKRQPLNKQSLITTKDIRVGDQLMIDYTSVVGGQLSYNERTQYLRNRMIQCSCVKCVQQK